MKRKSSRIQQAKKRKTRSPGAKAEIEGLVRTGVEDFILKDATIGEFQRTLRSAAKMEKVSSHPLTRSVFSRIVKATIRARKRKVDEFG